MLFEVEINSYHVLLIMPHCDMPRAMAFLSHHATRRTNQNRWNVDVNELGEAMSTGRADRGHQLQNGLVLAALEFHQHQGLSLG